MQNLDSKNQTEHYLKSLNELEEQIKENFIKSDSQ